MINIILANSGNHDKMLLSSITSWSNILFAYLLDSIQVKAYGRVLKGLSQVLAQVLIKDFCCIFHLVIWWCL